MDVIRVVIIDKSPQAIQTLTEILKSDQRINVVETAVTIECGIQRIERSTPDVLLIDVNLIETNKHSLLYLMLKQTRIPVIILSQPTVAETAKTIRAMSDGAVDFIKKRDKNDYFHDEKYKTELVKKVIAAHTFYRIKDTSSNKTNDEYSLATQNRSLLHRQSVKKEKALVAIGTSTGGPRALLRVLTDIPADFASPIFIVQHMPSGFTKSLAKRLNHVTNIPVMEAKDGLTVDEGTAYIAPGDFHMRIRQKNESLMIELNKDSLRDGHRPSVDVLFESIADIHNRHKVIVVLTGMGKDGSSGIKYIKKKDEQAFIIAESEETAVIHGMPKAAINTKCVDEVIHLDKVGKVITNYLKR